MMTDTTFGSQVTPDIRDSGPDCRDGSQEFESGQFSESGAVRNESAAEACEPRRWPVITLGIW